MMNDLRYEENEFFYSYKYIIIAQGDSLPVYTLEVNIGPCLVCAQSHSQPTSSQVEKKKKLFFFAVLHKVEAVMLLWWMNQSTDSQTF